MGQETRQKERADEESLLMFLCKVLIFLVLAILGLLALGVGGIIISFCKTGSGVLGGCGESDRNISYMLCIGGFIFMSVNLSYLWRVFTARRDKKLKETHRDTVGGS